MYLFDVNVWVHAHREDSRRHAEISGFVLETLNNGAPFAYSPLVLSGFLRIVTHPRIFTVPTDFDTARAFTASVTGHPAGHAVLPGPSHWSIFSHICHATKPAGNLFPDAYFAALAVESGCTWVTCDRDYTRFPGLNMKIL